MPRPGTDAVTVIGAGWAGLAAAIHLVRAGRSVRLLDAAPQAGGRARRITLQWEHPAEGVNPVELDNGQHLLLGAYTEVLQLLEVIGAMEEPRLQRRPMRLASSSGLLMERPGFASDRLGTAGSAIAGAVLAPLSPLLGLVRAQGLSAGSRWAMVRVFAQLRLAGWCPPPGVSTVAEWYRQARQPAELVERMWQPLVISALNTPADRACARTFLRVLRDSLGGPPGASDFVLPLRDLSDLFVDPALGWLRQHGAELMLRSDVRRIERGGTCRYRVVGSDRNTDNPLSIECRQVILATPPYASARLLEGVAEPSLVAELNRFQYLPITTAYLGWPHEALAPKDGFQEPIVPALMSLRESAAEHRFAQWFFDRGPQAHWRIAALVLSDSRAAHELGDNQLGEALTRQVTDELALPAPMQLSLIHEKRATIACTPDRPRLLPEAGPRLPGLALAGDYMYGDYPATLEGAVRSGRVAAEAVAGG